MNQLATIAEKNLTSLVPVNASKNQVSVLSEYDRYLVNTGSTWQTPDLAGFRDYLLTRNETRQVETRTGKVRTKRYGAIAPNTVKGMLSIVRSRLRNLVNDDAVQMMLLDQSRAQLKALGESHTLADVKAGRDILLDNLYRAVDPKRSAVKVETIQDRTQEQIGIRLTKGQASAMLASPGTTTLQKLRDTAILAMLLCTGIREQELCNLDVKDLRAKNGDGDLCVHVIEGKGKKTRLIPYGQGQWTLAVIDKWLESGHIAQGPVFRGFYKGNRKMRTGRMSTRQVQNIVTSYRVMVDGTLTTVRPHDLRRTYARRCYDSGMAILGIQQNLGHADHKTTLRYIGILNGEMRRPPALYHFDLGQLDKISVQDVLIIS